MLSEVAGGPQGQPTRVHQSQRCVTPSSAYTRKSKPESDRLLGSPLVRVLFTNGIIAADCVQGGECGALTTRIPGSGVLYCRPCSCIPVSHLPAPRASSSPASRPNPS